MHFDNIYSSHKSPNQTLGWTIIDQNQTVTPELNQTNSSLNKIDSYVPLFFLWITIFSVIILTLMKVLQRLEKSNVKNISIWSKSQAPCRNCIFFDKNEYLKCAVNPHAVLTKQANDCADYCNKYETCFQTNSQS